MELIGDTDTPFTAGHCLFCRWFVLNCSIRWMCDSGDFDSGATVPVTWLLLFSLFVIPSVVPSVVYTVLLFCGTLLLSVCIYRYVDS